MIPCKDGLWMDGHISLYSGDMALIGSHDSYLQSGFRKIDLRDATLPMHERLYRPYIIKCILAFKYLLVSSTSDFINYKSAALTQTPLNTGWFRSNPKHQ